MNSFNLPPGVRVRDLTSEDQEPHCAECGCLLPIHRLAKDGDVCLECQEAMEDRQ